VYPGECHCFATTNAEDFNADLLAFMEGRAVAGAG
jgi:hypothetical protein